MEVEPKSQHKTAVFIFKRTKHTLFSSRCISTMYMQLLNRLHVRLQLGVLSTTPFGYLLPFIITSYFSNDVAEPEIRHTVIQKS